MSPVDDTLLSEKDDEIDAYSLFQELADDLSLHQLHKTLGFLPCNPDHFKCEKRCPRSCLLPGNAASCNSVEAKWYIKHSFMCHKFDESVVRTFLMRHKCAKLFNEITQIPTMYTTHILISQLKTLADYSQEWSSDFFQTASHVDHIYHFLVQKLEEKKPKDAPAPINLYSKTIDELCKHHVAEVEKEITVQMMKGKRVFFSYLIEQGGISDHVANHIKTASGGRFEVCITPTSLIISIKKGALARPLETP